MGYDFGVYLTLSNIWLKNNCIILKKLVKSERFCGKGGKVFKILVGGANALRQNPEVPAARVLAHWRPGAWKSVSLTDARKRRENWNVLKILHTWGWYRLPKAHMASIEDAEFRNSNSEYYWVLITQRLSRFPRCLKTNIGIIWKNIYFFKTPMILVITSDSPSLLIIC